MHIKGYANSIANLPSNAAQGDIYGVGPTYDPSDTEHTNPIYQLYVKSNVGWVNLEGLVSSGKLFLKSNQYYTAQNIKAYPSINAMYIAAFDANDNYLGRTVISLQSDLSATFIYNKLQGAFYERIVLTRGKAAYIQKRMASIVESVIRNL